MQRVQRQERCDGVVSVGRIECGRLKCSANVSVPSGAAIAARRTQQRDEAEDETDGK